MAHPSVRGRRGAARLASRNKSRSPGLQKRGRAHFIQNGNDDKAVDEKGMKKVGGRGHASPSNFKLTSLSQTHKARSSPSDTIWLHAHQCALEVHATFYDEQPQHLSLVENETY